MRTNGARRAGVIEVKKEIEESLANQNEYRVCLGGKYEKGNLEGKRKGGAFPNLSLTETVASGGRNHEGNGSGGSSKILVGSDYRKRKKA